LRTPLATGQAFEEQADALAALLDVLEVEQVVAYAFSGGGPSGIQFAARHPERTRALVLSCAVTQAHRWNFPAWARLLLRSATIFRLQIWLLDKFPRAMINAMLEGESTYDASERARVATMIANTPDSLRFMRQGVASQTPMEPRMAGLNNDLEQIAAIDKLPLEDVQCPTLICHGTADGDVPFSHAEAAYGSIPNAQLYRMEGAWHLLWVDEGAEEMVQAQVEFVKAQLAEREAGSG
jgi:pimeloyl-ACP methyl ester carboxylesterase